MLMIIPGLLILIYSLSDFKKALKLFLLYEMIWYPSAELFSLGGERSLTIGFFMTFALSLNFFFLRGGIYKIKKSRFPLWKPFVFLGFSYILTPFFSYAGFEAEIFRAVIILFQNFFIVIVIWCTFTTRKDYSRLFAGLIITYFFSSIYGFVEYLIKYNPLAVYKSRLSTEGIEFYSISGARGYRLMATFEHPIAAGMMFALFVIFSLVYISKNNKWNNYSIIICAVLSTACIILSKMRAGLVFAFVGALSVVDFKKKKFYKILFVSLLGLILVSPLLIENQTIFLSIFNQKAQGQIGGSSLEQRLGQLEAVINLLKLSPIAGLGEKFQKSLVNYNTVKALGYESVWLEQTAKHGIIGVLANLVLAYYSVIKIPRQYKSRPAFFLALSFWITYSMTIVTSFRMDIYYLIYFYFIRFMGKENIQIHNHNIDASIINKCKE